MKYIYKYISALLTFIFIITGANILAQDNENQLIQQLRETVKNEYFNVSSLVQFRMTAAFDDQSPAASTGFEAPNARLRVDGKLDGGFSYKIHFDVANNPVLLDAEIGYRFNPNTAISVGAQKPGISYEFLQGPNVTDFVRRSQIVTALTQNRDVGIRLHGKFTENLNYSVGMFNGNGLNANDNNAFYYAARLGYDNNKSDGQLLIGLNTSYGNQSNTRIAGGTLPNINGDRLLFGADFRYTNSSILLSSEVIAAQTNYTGFTTEDQLFGYHITGGYMVSDKTQLLLRWDSISSDLLTYLNNSDKLIAGVSFFPTSQTRIRLNYILPVDQYYFNNHRIAANFQIEF